MLAPKWKIVKILPNHLYGQHFLLELNKNSILILERSNYIVMFKIMRRFLRLVVNPDCADIVTVDGPSRNQHSSQLDCDCFPEDLICKSNIEAALIQES